VLPDVDEFPSSARRRAVLAAGAVAAAIALWRLLAVVLSTDRGIDLTDEGLYILAADPPSRTAAWVVPWGWHTRPLFRMVGFDLANLRTLAAFIIVVAGGLLGWLVARLVNREQQSPLMTSSAVTTITLVGVGALGAPMLMASMLRTPGYNWVNLTGITTTCIGALVAATLDGSAVGWRSKSAHAAAALLAVGATFTIPAKPTSGPLVLFAALIVLVPRLGWKPCIRLAGLVVGWITVTVTMLLVTRVWPINFIGVLRESTAFPTPAESQTLPGALAALARLPLTIWNACADLTASTQWIIAIAIVLAIVLRFWKRAHWSVRCAPLLLMVVAALGVTGPWPKLGAAHPKGRYVWIGTANGATLLLLGALLHLLANWDAGTRATRRRLLPVALFLYVASVIYAFGSGTGLYRQMGLASLLLWLAAACIVTVGDRSVARQLALGILLVAAMVISVGTIIDSRHHPYRGVDLAQQRTPYQLGGRKIDLLVDTSTADFLTAMQRGAEEGGWCAGTPLIGMVWRWSSTVPYALGATVPDTLMFTLFGYQGSSAVAEYSIQRADPAVWRDAWILTTDPTTLKRAFAASMKEAIDLLQPVTARPFPDGYTIVSDVDGTQLWRPRNVGNPCGGVRP